ncbi:hypothetical protein UWK_02728 [Desulfocapsa sulfexigens DSM 10523]|uniref:Uncharacterized protein n=1 Tax=Desulfocapsa sulfexigens (strain DSM 10523 / SB164P1) TaxID=1167006 RepID=M1NI56_DESSD|nr:hypothetical protein [Desulfocapsa sulfexigens]AGF79264.1 hypothetical protein UWK_02728 [Desulfocapsa sulfexigens DSM 10523]
MSGKDIDKILKQLEKKQENDQGSQNEEISKEIWDYSEPEKRSYQPTTYELDDDDPPEDDD